jgi:hypothetical protein
VENKPFNKPVVSNYRPSIIDETEHWILGDGSLQPQVLVADGDWSTCVPEGERQNKNGLETVNCTNYSLLNCIETIGRLKYGTSFQSNLSERERGIRSGTTIYGNYIHNVCEKLRLQGTIPEDFLPFNDKITTWNEYYSPRILPYWMWKVSESWKRKYQYNHDWGFLYGDSLEIRQAKMLEALKFSPLSVAGYAWSRHADGLYHSDGFTTNHAFDIVKGVKGEYWLALDSYPDETGSFQKKLDWNYNFAEAKRHSLTRRLGGNTDVEPKYTKYLLYVFGEYIKDIFR